MTSVTGATAMPGERRLVQQMQPSDNVATALVELPPGTLVRLSRSDGTLLEVTVSATVPIPFGHKVALRAIPAGEPVLKYGEEIGLASSAIPAGAHVHTHNVDSQRGRGDLHR